MEKNYLSSLKGINHIEKLLSYKIRIVYDPNNQIDEYFIVPKLLNLINSQTDIPYNNIEQRKITLIEVTKDEAISIISSITDNFYFKDNRDKRIEIIFDSVHDLHNFRNKIKIKYQINRYFIDFYEIKYKITADSIFILGPINIDERDLADALKEIDDNIDVKRTICQSSNIQTDFFILKIHNHKIIDLFKKMLSFIKIKHQNLNFVNLFENTEIINLNSLFPVKFLVSAPVLISKIETKIIQILNLFLPYEVTTKKVNEITEAFENFKFENGKIHILYNKNEFHRSHGRVFIECDSLEYSKQIFQKLGGLIFDGRPIITTFYSEIAFKAKIFEHQI